VLLLSVIQGPDKGRRFELPDHEPQLIGRSSESLYLGDNTISRRHAELTPNAGRWYIRDLQSQNGTFVNGVRIRERTLLRPGDQVRTGATLFLFGAAEAGDPGLIHLVRPGELEYEIERTLASNEDSVVLAEPEPAAAAVEHLRILYDLMVLTTTETDRQRLLEGVMDLVFQEMKPERGFVMLLEDVPEPALRPAVIRYATLPAERAEATIHVSRTILQHVIRRAEGVLSSNAMHDPRFAAGDSVQQFRIRSAICAPIRFRERTRGAIYIDTSLANYTFTEQQLALMNAIGRHTGLVLANADLYAQKLQSERLAAIGETVASLAHSIRNILQGLKGGADVVEMGLRRDELALARSGWDILKRNLDRIAGLSTNMLAFGRQRHPELELARIGPIVEDCAQLLESLAAARRAALIIDVDAEMPPVPIDASLIHQALMNLMTNALEAVPAETGAVTVRASFHASGARGEGSPAVAEIMVIDNGPGMSREARARLFEPFRTTKGTRGTGLGLAVTKRIVEEHGGRVHVQSDAGRGATFRVVLPAERPRVGDPSDTATDRPDLRGL
jgi:two-component system NtrC family sensor kinase